MRLVGLSPTSENLTSATAANRERGAAHPWLARFGAWDERPRDLKARRGRASPSGLNLSERVQPKWSLGGRRRRVGERM